MQIVIYQFGDKVASYAINPIGANVDEKDILCFGLQEEMTSKVELAFQLAWHKGLDIMKGI